MGPLPLEGANAHLIHSKLLLFYQECQLALEALCPVLSLLWPLGPRCTQGGDAEENPGFTEESPPPVSTVRVLFWGGKGEWVQLPLEISSLHRNSTSLLGILWVGGQTAPSLVKFTPENRLGRPYGPGVCFAFQRLGTVRLIFSLKICINFCPPPSHFNVIPGYLISTNHLRGGGRRNLMWNSTQGNPAK